ncbi:MAG: hypothetical protein JWL81_445, partial [Verrucomicrobiales bacterium]|nr:hypothetical protein [Verrucomicrobiales bacterium]
GDGRNNDASSEDDIDGDGFSDDDDSEMDIDGDSRSDDDDMDIDGDNRSNGDAAENDTDGDDKSDGAVTEMNDDGDSKGNRDDMDDDNDGDSDEDDADHRQEDDEMEVEVNLSRQAAAPSGSRVQVKIQKMASGKVQFALDARDLPAGSYSVVIDGAPIGNLVMILDGNRTEGEQEWETNPNKSNELPLTFDIIGKSIGIISGGTTYFTGTVPTPPTYTGGGTVPPTAVPGVLVRGAAAPSGAEGHVEIDFSLTGAKELEIEIEDVPAGSYEVLVGDAVRGTLTATAGENGVRGQLVFEVSPEMSEGELLLNFAAAGEPVTIRQGTDIFFTGTVPPAPAGVGDGVVGNDDNGDDNGGGVPVTATLTRGSTAPAGSKAEVQIQFGAAGATGLEVEIEDAAPGAYDLLIDGTPRGFVEVVSSPDGVKGKLRFETAPNDPDELPLDFVAAGKSITLTQGATVLFSGTVPTQPAI